MLLGAGVVLYKISESAVVSFRPQLTKYPAPDVIGQPIDLMLSAWHCLTSSLSFKNGLA